MTALDLVLYYAFDPVACANETFGLGYVLDPTQAEILTSSSARMIVNCCRQWGKTSTIAAKGAIEAINEPGLILVIAPVERQAKELFRKLRANIRNYLKAVESDLTFLEENKTSLELSNGARVVALPALGENIRGYTNPRLIIIDEAAYVKDEDYRAIRPMLSHGARLVIMSTPFGKRGFFYETWERADRKWERYSVQASSCAHIPASFLAEERTTLGPLWYTQEYECVFNDTTGGFIDMEAVRSCLDDGVRPLFPLQGTGNREYIDDQVQPLLAAL